MHEAQMHEVSSFVTLTLDDDHYIPSLDHGVFQKFMKRLRRALGPTRFFMAGEYGTLHNRPHYHALLFGQGFPDRQKLTNTLYRSRTLELLWPFGFSSIGDVTHESAMYVAKYSCKKVYGAAASGYYTRVDLRTGEYVRVRPEYGAMSRNPGLGQTWFKRYWPEVYLARDGIVRPGGKQIKAPRYYDELLEVADQDLRSYKDLDRYVRSGQFAHECSPERLREREICAEAQLQRKRVQL